MRQPRERLGEDVGELVYGACVGELDDIVGHHVSKHMKPYVDMLCPLVCDWVVGEVYRCLVVTM